MHVFIDIMHINYEKTSDWSNHSSHFFVVNVKATLLDNISK